MIGLQEHASHVKAQYAGGQERPLGSYGALMSAYGVGVGALGLASLLRSKALPDRYDLRDLVLASIATGKFARVIAKDPVTSPLRAPFTRFRGTSADSELAEEVRGTGPQKALGEFITCPFCIGEWLATAFVAGIALAPRATRAVAAVGVVTFGADVMQYLYTQLQQTE